MHKPCLLHVGACIAGPQRCGGIFFGLQLRQGRAEPSPAPTAKSQNSVKNSTHSLAVYSRGGALLHPRGLAAAQGFGGRAMLAPTMKLRNSDINFTQALPIACRGLHCRPANGAGEYFLVCSCGKGGRSQAPPLRQNCEITLKFISTLSRHIVGVGLCSTRGALRHHRALAGEQCPPLR